MDRAAVDTYTLSEDCSISVAPGWGCNMFSWRAGGKELMFCPQDHPAAAQKITGGGNPLLFPSVGRTWDTSVNPPKQGAYSIYGIDREFFMPSHGVLFFCEFNKTEELRGNGSLTVKYDTSIPAKVMEENFPFNLQFSQRYTLHADRVVLESAITNAGDAIAPAAFGYHPYFRVARPDREGVEVRLPVKKRLMLTADTVLLTGKSEDTNGIISMVPDIYYDYAFAEPIGSRMSLIDSTAGNAIHVDFDEKLELFFLYSPDGSDFVCIEPWTRGLGAYEHLKEPGWESGKFIPVLQPGENITYRATFSVEKL